MIGIITTAVHFLALPIACWHFPEAEFGNISTLRSFRFKDRHTTRQSVDDADGVTWTKPNR